MANIKTVLMPSERFEGEIELQVYANQHNEIYIELNRTSEEPFYQYSFTCLDKNTAIKLVKILKSEISKLD